MASSTPTPAAAPLTKDRIVEQAMALVARDGPEGLSMRRLAASLGTSTMSTYHHLPDKRALLDAMAERIMSELETPDDDVPWDESLRRLAWSFRTLTRRHRHAFQLLLAGPRPEPLVRTAESVVARLIDAGFEPDRAVLVFRTCIRYLLGVSMVETIADDEDNAELDTTFAFGIEALLRGVESPG